MEVRKEVRKLTKGERTRNRILDVAEQTFASKGYESSNLREIAEVVGIQEPGIYRHFSGKEEIYREVLNRALIPLQKLLGQKLQSGLDKNGLQELPGQVFDLFLEHPSVALLFHQALLSEFNKNNPIHEWINGFFEQAKNIVKNVTNETLDQDLVALRVLALFNVCIGYFSSRSLMPILAGKRGNNRARQKHQVTEQKKILNEMMASWL